MATLPHQLLEDHARTHGTREALRMHGISWNYDELNQRAESLAGLLVENAVKDGDFVAIYMEKSLSLVACLVGILKVGAVYVPLDIDAPEERIVDILEDCGISAVLTDASSGMCITRIVKASQGSRRVIVVSEQDEKHDADRPEATYGDVERGRIAHLQGVRRERIGGHQLATVLYTSGSTGKPKGVMISCESIMVFAKWAVETFGIRFHDKLISHAPLHFDLSLFDIFGALFAGACCVLVPKSKVGNPKYLAAIIAKEEISIWQSVPSALVLVAKYGDLPNNAPGTLRHVLFAGEIMPVDSLRILLAAFESAQFHNIYGCTETNDTFLYSVERENIPDLLPIGRPLPYVEYKIVNEKDQEVAAGERGELLVAGPTVMAGYRSGDRSCFGYVQGASPTHIQGQAFYRTRDVVARLADGNVYFYGRNDSIIKSNGYRINLLEVEHCLKTNASLREVAVFSVPDSAIGNKIFALVTLEPGARVSVVDLKRFCAARLSPYMIPQGIEIRKDPLPKTSSGKVNSKALAAEKRAA